MVEGGCLPSSFILFSGMSVSRVDYFCGLGSFWGRTCITSHMHRFGLKKSFGIKGGGGGDDMPMVATARIGEV